MGDISPKRSKKYLYNLHKQKEVTMTSFFSSFCARHNSIQDVKQGSQQEAEASSIRERLDNISSQNNGFCPKKGSLRKFLKQKKIVCVNFCVRVLHICEKFCTFASFFARVRHVEVAIRRFMGGFLR